MPGNRSFQGMAIEVRSFSGGRAVRVAHPGGQIIGEHRHDWPLLTIPTLGGYDEHYDGSQAPIGSPAVVFHPAGRCHSNLIHPQGLETFSIEFETDWLKRYGVTDWLDQSRQWAGGAVALAAKRLMRVWSRPSLPEAEARQAIGDFLGFARSTGTDSPPVWLGKVRRLLDDSEPPPTDSIARMLDLHPAWLARTYRSAVGEGIHQTVSRKRVERAVALLRSTDLSLADIAHSIGFCDQSHFNRAVRRHVGRTPQQVRAERMLLGRIATV